MRDEQDDFRFARESFADAEQEGAKAAAECLPSFLAERTPGDEALSRLLSSVEALPERYAPFYGQLAELFDLEEDALLRQLHRARDKGNWKASGLPGVRIFGMAGGASLAGASTLLVRFNRGARFPAHTHRSTDRTLILEGGYQDERGRDFHPGDRDDRLSTDGAHSFRVFDDAPCVAAAVHYGFDFTFWPLRMFQRLMGH